MGREKDLAKNTAILMLGTCLPKVASFVVLPILTGQLTKDEYGTYDLVTIMVTLFLPTITLQLQTSSFRFLVDARGNEARQRSIVSTIFAITVPISVTALSLFYFFLSGQDAIIRLLICLYFFFDIIANTIRQTLRGLGDNASYSVSAIIDSVVQLILAVALVQNLKLGLLGAVSMLVVSSGISLVFLLVKSRLRKLFCPSAISMEQLRECLRYSLPLVPNYMAMWVMRLSNRVIITLFMGVSANALFAAAYKIPQILTLLQNTFSMAWQENASLTKDADDANVYYEKMFGRIFRLLAGFFTLLLAAIPFLFAILIQGEYQESFFQIPLILIAIFLYCLCSFMGGIYVAFMKTANVGITTIVAAGINVILCVILIPSIGLYGASFAMILSFSFLFLFRFFDLRAYGVRLKLDVRIVLPFVVVATIQGAFMWQLNWTLNFLNIVIAIVYCLIACKSQLLSIGKKLVKKIAR